MNTPNKLTLLRICMVPLFVAFMLIPQMPYHYLWALAVFVLASVTDAADGHLARKHGLITDFGKILDPLADKVLVCSALICLVELGHISSVIAVIIVAREFLVTSLRLVASGSGGVVIAAGTLGKLKTVSQMTGIIILLLLNGLEPFGISPSVIYADLIGNVFLWIATVLTVVSGIQYMWSYRSFIDVRK